VYFFLAILRPFLSPEYHYCWTSLVRAGHFLKNYDTLTFFLADAETPIDNNAQERNLRSHVMGRKSWYGTHSKRGALTAAILFSIVETCKLAGVNPRQYFECLVNDLLYGAAPYTPAQYKKSH
jgi:hypothetical protein